MNRRKFISGTAIAVTAGATGVLANVLFGCQFSLLEGPNYDRLIDSNNHIVALFRRTQYGVVLEECSIHPY